jgi:TonB family protein
MATAGGGVLAQLVAPTGEHVGSRPAFLIATLLAGVQFGLLMPPTFGAGGPATTQQVVSKPALYLLPLWPTQRTEPHAERVQWTTIGADHRARPVAGFAAAIHPKREAGRPRSAAVMAPVAVKDSEPTVYDGSRVYIEPELEHPVSRDPSSDGPMYPDSLRAHGVEGLVVIRFIVDTGGHADSSTLRLIEATHPGFAAAVRSALPRMRFIPAELAGRHVPQLVSQEFRFVITRVDTITVAGRRRAKA